MLIDAKAALCAIAKGRTNAPAFHQTLCSINALLLATDTLLRPVYVPSEDNPADAPSRGRRRRLVNRRVLQKPGFCKAERGLHRLQQEGLIGSLADNYYSCMGGIYSQRRVQEDLIPNLRTAMAAEGIDVLLLVPL